MIKLVITAIIVIAVVLMLFSSHPAVSGIVSWLENIPSRFALPEEKAKIEFVLNIDTVPNMTLSLDGADLEIDGNTSGTIASGRINTQRLLAVDNFTGSIVLTDTIVLRGSYSETRLPDVYFDAGEINVTSRYSRAEVEKFSIKSLTMEGAGTLSVNGTETQFSGEIEIESLTGSIAASETLRIEGTARKISIPTAGLRIE